jgi:lysophospholipid acyltransferase
MGILGLDPFFDSIATSLSSDADSIKYVVGLLSNYVSGAVFALLPSPVIKNVFSIVIGLSLAFFIFKDQAYHLVISSLVSFLILHACSLSKTAFKYQHIVTFSFMLIYLSVIHIYRMYNDYLGWSLDISGPLMILTIKITSLSYNIYDGVIAKKSYEETLESKQAPNSLILVYKDRISRSIDHIPSVLQYFGYMFHFSSLLAGPAFEYKEYCDSIHNIPFIETSPSSSSLSGKKKSGMPLESKVNFHWSSRLVASFSKLGGGLLLLAIHVLLKEKYSLEYMYAGSWSTRPFLVRMLEAYVITFVIRARYFFAWKASEGAANIAGFGYNSGSWEGVSNIDVISFESANSLTQGSKHWNKSASSWLGKYCNSRVPRGYNLLATYLLASIWHGYYPGYYLFYLSASMVQSVEKMLVARIGRPNGPLAKAAWHIAVPLMLNYLVLPFLLLGFDRSVFVWKSLYFVGHVFAAAVWLVLVFLGPSQTKNE